MEAVATDLVLAGIAATRPIADADSGDEDAPKLWDIAKTSICLREAVMAARCRGVFIDPETILAVMAKAKIPQTSDTIAGTALYQIILLAMRCPGRSLLFGNGLIELRRRVRTTSLTKPLRFPREEKNDWLPTSPIIDAIELARTVRNAMSEPFEAADLVAERLLVTAALAESGATRKWRLLLGGEISPAMLRKLDETREDPALWCRTLLSCLAASARQQHRHIRRIHRIYQEYAGKITGNRTARQLRLAALGIIFDQPILSRADLMRRLERLGLECAERTAQGILADFAGAGIIRSYGSKTLWQATNLALSGIVSADGEEARSAIRTQPDATTNPSATNSDE